VDQRVDDELEIEVSAGDRVVLSRSALDSARNDAPEIVAFLKGESDSFPPFETPVYEGEQGLVEVEPGYFEEQGYYGGPLESRLIHFAHLVRPFVWLEDPRGDHLKELVGRALSAEGAREIEGTSTQDLWDALFAFARGERFVEGLIASQAAELTIVANTIRDRLLAIRRPQKRNIRNQQ
jgi:hypothetical protein